MKGNFQRLKARARFSKKQILILLEAKGGDLIPFYISHKHRLSCEKYKMRKTRLIIILWGFVWPQEGDRKYCFMFEP